VVFLPPKKPQHRRRRRRDPALSTDVVAAALDGLGLTDYARMLRITAAWREAVGDEIAARTHPSSFSRGTLVVRTKNAAWQNELTFLKSEIIDRVNAALGNKSVDELKIQAGHIPDPPERGRPAWLRAPLPPEETALVSSAASGIEDPEVRRAFAAAMGTYRKVERQAAGPSTKPRTSGEKP
jgi:hypothetical protein